METGLVKTEHTGELVSLQGVGQAELVYAELQIPPDMVYYIGKGADGIARGGIYASYWNLIAREMGMHFDEPKIIEHSEDRVTLSVSDLFYNTRGRECRDSEIVSIDAKKMYQETRLKWVPTKRIKGDEGWETITDEEALAKLQEKGFCIDDVQYGADGIPTGINRKLPPEREKEIWVNYLTIKKNLLAKSITVAHRRLTQRACAVNGVKMPDKKKKDWQQDLKIQIYTFLLKGQKAVYKPADITIAERNDIAEDDETEQEGKLEPENRQEVKTVEKPVEKAPERQPDTTATTSNGQKYPCSFDDCKKMVSQKVHDFSEEHFGAILCLDHQPSRKK